MSNSFTDTDVERIEHIPTDSQTIDATFDLILLDPTRVRLFRTGGDAVRATITDPQIGQEQSFLRVQVARAFPLSKANQYIGLRDDKDKDIGMLKTLDGMDPESRGVVDAELRRRYFLPRVESVKSIKEEYGTITLVAQTDKGERTFYIQNLRDSVQDLPPHRLLITDRDGNRFEFPDTEHLDAKTYNILQRVL